MDDMNRRVAELRGLKTWIANGTEYLGILHGYVDKGTVCCLIPNDPNNASAPAPDYLHSLDACKELIEEMDADGYSVPNIYKQDKDNLWHVAFRVAGDQGFDFYEADTIEEAICTAYIAWKEAQNVHNS
jgi:hypothetical protein